MRTSPTDVTSVWDYIPRQFLAMPLCWLCLQSEGDDPLKQWIATCSCSLEAHESCLIEWIQALEPEGRRVQCPQCLKDIDIEVRENRIVKWRRRIEYIVRYTITASAAGTAVLTLSTVVHKTLRSIGAAYITIGCSDAQLQRVMFDLPNEKSPMSSLTGLMALICPVPLALSVIPLGSSISNRMRREALLPLLPIAASSLRVHSLGTELFVCSTIFAGLTSSTHLSEDGWIALIPVLRLVHRVTRMILCRACPTVRELLGQRWDPVGTLTANQEAIAMGAAQPRAELARNGQLDGNINRRLIEALVVVGFLFEGVFFGREYLIELQQGQGAPDGEVEQGAPIIIEPRLATIRWILGLETSPVKKKDLSFFASVFYPAILPLLGGLVARSVGNIRYLGRIPMLARTMGAVCAIVVIKDGVNLLTAWAARRPYVHIGASSTSVPAEALHARRR